MQNKVALHTLGCKLNFSETSSIGKQFLGRGYDIVDFSQPANVYVINTCTVTENADRECRQIVRRALRNNPEAFVVVTGCYAQLRAEEIARIDGVDLVLGSSEKFRLFDYAEDFSKNELSCIYVSPTEELENDFGAASSTDADSRTRAFFKIQDGCDYKCSFCTIPRARGASRSLAPDEAVRQFKTLINEGYKEVILTGVNTGDYGKNMNTDLYALLLRLVAVPGDFRIRISSIEPNLLTDEIIALAASNEKMCDHFHIPLQSGSDTMLRLMQRRYNSDDYRSRILKINELMPDAGIGVDVIVGFPGETEEKFRTTYDFLKALPVSYLHVFTYSERPDTKAVTMPGSVDKHERKERNNRLRILSAKKRAHFYQQNMGKTVDVLFEHTDHDGRMKGFSSNYIRVSHSFDESKTNEFVQITLQDMDAGECSGIEAGTKESLVSS